MSQQYINIYQSARQAAGLTQERAAERVGKSVESIRAYESDARLPDDDTVILMADVYDAKYLAYQHLQKSALGRKIMPALDPKELAASILKLQKEVNDFLKSRDDLIDIGSDGEITDDERPRWNDIIKELDDIMVAILSIKFIK